MIRVLLVDDHAYVRHALREVLGHTDDIEVIGECSDGGEVVEAVQFTDPDVVLMDLAMPRVTGLEAVEQMRTALLSTPVLMLTGTVDVASVRAARALGVSGYLVKGENPEGLAEAIRTVAGGGATWSPHAAAYLPTGSRPGRL